VKNLIKAALAIWICSLPTVGLSVPIPGADLFQAPGLYYLRINPPGDIVSAVLTDGEEQHLSFLDVQGDTFVSALKFNSGTDLRSYRWVDDDSIMLVFNDGKQDAFGIISVTRNQDTGIQATFRRIPVQGYLLDPLLDRNDEVMFVEVSGEQHKIFKATFDDLVSGNLKYSSRLRNELDDATHYQYDQNKSTLMARKFDVEKKEESVWYLGDDKQWHLIHRWNYIDFEFEPLAFADNGTLFVLTDRLSDTVSVVKFDVASQTFQDVVYQHPRYDLDSARISGDGKVISVSYFDHGRYTESFPGSDGRLSLSKRLQKTFSGKQIQVVAESGVSGLQVIRVFSSDDPGTYYLLSPQNNEARIIDHVQPSVANYQLAKSELITIPAPDGVEIEAFLTRPASESNRTLLVMPHGGPIGVRDLDSFDPEVQYLASRGYSVLRVNFRGSAGYGREFRQSGIGGFGTVIEQDIEAAVNYVDERYEFDHACTIGGSYGGYSAVLMATRNPDRYQCAVGMFGVYDLSLLFNESNFRTSEEYREFVSRTVGEYSENLKTVSPTYLAKNLNVPVLLTAGKEDPVAVFEHSNRLKYLLKKLGKPVDTLFYDHVAHGHHTWWGNRHQMAYIDDFFRRHLGLPEPKASESIQLEEDLLLAESFEFGDGVDVDGKRAFHYYRRAADNGSAQAMYRLAGYYEDGEVVAEDHDQAIKWLKRASESGLWEATLDLGMLYQKGALVQQNPHLAVQMFELAETQGADHRAKIYLAENICLGSGVEMDLKKCTESLTPQEKADGSSSESEKAAYARKTTLARILTDDAISSEVLAMIKDLMRKEYGVKWYSAVVEEEHFGLYRLYRMEDLRMDPEALRELAYSTSDYKLLEQTETVPLRADGYFGLHFSVDGDYERDKDRTAVIVRYTRTDLTEGEAVVKKAVLLYGSTSANWNSVLKLAPANQYLNSRWTIDVFTVDGEKIHSRDFTFVPGG
jgi:dienelactone hydrolase